MALAILVKKFHIEDPEAYHEVMRMDSNTFW